MSDKRNVLVTGGTGFVGMAVLTRLVDQSAYDKIYLLVRPRLGQSAASRVDEIVGKLFAPSKAESVRGRIVAVSGDLTSPELGLAEEDRRRLLADCHQILHVGASTDFGAPIAESRLANVEGTRNALDLGVSLKDHGCMARFDYVSTAYVAGRKRGVVREHDLVRRQAFANNYEQSKYEAELLVRQYAERLPTAIYRPSIIVGDSANGYTPSFKVLYWPLLLLAKGLLPFFACNQKARLDVVPVDYVADALVALMQREESLGDTFHLTAGLGHEIRIRTVLRDAYELAGIAAKPILPFWLFAIIAKTPLRHRYEQTFWQTVELAKPYDCYLRGSGVRFDAQKTHAQLAAFGIHAPRWKDYRREVFNYCLMSRWGRKMPMPQYVYYLSERRLDRHGVMQGPQATA